MKKVESGNVNNNRLSLCPTTLSCWTFTAVFPSFPHFFFPVRRLSCINIIFRECSEWKENEKRQQNFHRKSSKNNKTTRTLEDMNLVWLWRWRRQSRNLLCGALLRDYSSTTCSLSPPKALSVSPSCTLHISCRCWLYENKMRHIQQLDGDNHDAHIIRSRFEVPITIKMSHTKATEANDSGRHRGKAHSHETIWTLGENDFHVDSLSWVWGGEEMRRIFDMIAGYFAFIPIDWRSTSRNHLASCQKSIGK